MLTNHNYRPVAPTELELLNGKSDWDDGIGASEIRDAFNDLTALHAPLNIHVWITVPIFSFVTL